MNSFLSSSVFSYLIKFTNIFFIIFFSPMAFTDSSETLDKSKSSVITVNHVVGAITKNSPFYQELTLNLDKEVAGLQAKKGAFDTQLKSKYDSIDKSSVFDGFQVSLEQPLGFAGTQLFGTYRTTNGSLPLYWDKDGTNAGGELAMGLSVKPLRGLFIDKRRASLKKQSLALEGFRHEFSQSTLELIYKGLGLYYYWALAHQKLNAFQQLLDVALNRDRWLRVRVKKGDRARIEVDENQRVILNRQAEVAKQKTKAQLAFRQLNLFLGNPYTSAESSYLPVRLKDDKFPFPMKLRGLRAWIKSASQQRQDLKALSLKIEEKKVEYRLQSQNRLPDLSLSGAMAQDRGASRGEFDGNEVRIQGTLSFPLWMREARGKTRMAKADVEMAKVKRRYGQQKIETQLKNSWDTLALLKKQLSLKRREVELSEKLEKAEQKRFRYGGSSLININIRETDFIRSQIKYIEIRAQSHIESIKFYVTAGQLPPSLQISK